MTDIIRIGSFFLLDMRHTRAISAKEEIPVKTSPKGASQEKQCIRNLLRISGDKRLILLE